MKSDRLQLRPFEDSDLDALHALWTDPDVRRYLWENLELSRDDTAKLLARSRQMFEDEKTGLLAVTPADGDELIGFGGFWYFGEPPRRQILFGLAPEHWGMGLASELARLLITHGFETLGDSKVIGATDSSNISSQRVMEKAGMKFDRRDRSGSRDIMYFVARR
ncbi:MAG: GNAT family N-acetyltransferase [Gammaproteobacteria bacterium]|nr:GNAT family N-acetyltransferase [Gammaproteobacteria bacterium]